MLNRWLELGGVFGNLRRLHMTPDVHFEGNTKEDLEVRNER